MPGPINPSNFSEQVADLLTRGEFNYTARPSIEGLRPDFLVESPDGKRVVIETKLWRPTVDNLARAKRQANSVRSVTGVDGAIIVMPGLGKRMSPQKVVATDLEVVGTDNLDKVISEMLISHARATNNTPVQVTSSNRIVFAAMPFDEIYNDTFFVAMRPAAMSVSASCVRVDLERFSGDIVEEIRKDIRESIAVVADLSGSKPNVLYEVGFAHALGKPTVHICSTALKDLPFDVSHWNTLQYNLGQTSRLAPVLAQLLKESLGESG